MSRLHPYLILALLTLVACGTPSAEDGPVTIATESVALELPSEGPAFIPTLDGPLRLLSATPAGELADLPGDLAVAITFSQPMVALGSPPPPPPGLITLTPEVAGTLRWEGTQTLVFTPLAPLSPATTYTATLSNTLTALEGGTLDAPFTWTFTTPRPALLASSPTDGERYADPRQAIRLSFNLPVDAATATPFIRLTSNDLAVAHTVHNEGDSVLVVQTTTAMGNNTPYELHLRSGLRSTAGPLPIAEEHTIAFKTYGPLLLEAIDQPRNWWEDPQDTFDPQRGLTLVFSNPVRFEDVRQAVTFEPEVTLPAGIEAQDDMVSTHHTLPLTWLPETTYRVTVAGVQDAFGQTLAPTTERFTTRAFRPSVQMPQGVLVVEAQQQAVLPVRVVNVDDALLGLQRLTQADIIPALRAYDDDRWYGPLPEGAEEPQPIAPSRHLPFELPRNTVGTFLLRLDSLMNGGTGVVGLQVQVAKQEGWSRERAFKALAQVTRMGISAKFSPHQNLIFVTDLATAAPVAEARVTIRDADNMVRWEGVTDAQGRALSPGWHGLGITPPSEWDQPRQYVFVEKDGDLAFTSSVFDDGLEPYRFDLPYAWRPEALTTAGSVFSDRGLYRAGETVHLKGILRSRTDGDWQALRDSIRILIDSPRDQRVLDQTLAPTDLGTFHLDWKAPGNAAQGGYRVRVAYASDADAADREPWEDGDIANGTFRVDAFRRATFSVTTTTAAPSYTAGDFFEGTLNGRYLFGAAMGGQPYRYTLTRESGPYQPPGFEAYQFGSYSYGYGSSVYLELADQEGELDADGNAQVRVQVPGNPHGRTAQLVFSGSVVDPAQQESYARTEVTLHPGLFYIGLKPNTTFLDLSHDPTLVVDVVTVTPDGRAAEAQAVQVEVMRRQWDSIREVGVDGRLTWRSEYREETVATDHVRTEPGRAQRLRIQVPKGGSYLIRATGRDRRGNTIKSEAYFYATGSGYVAWERRDDDRIELIADQPRYAPGETARIMVQSPYASATALITVERDGILSSRVTTLTGSAPQVEVHLTEDHLPNAFVSVMLIQGRTAPPGTTDDTGAPAFKIGYVELSVDPGVRHLAVAVTPDADTYRPGDEVTVDLQLRDQGGRGVPGEIAFSAADAGVLNLIGYALPDPFDAFYGSRPLRVTSTETRANLVKQRNYGQKEEDEGGGGGDDGNNLRTDFRPSAHWVPALRTDASGRASVTFRLPESLTTFRLMATASTADNKFGAGRTDIVVTKPLVLQPALPRFARMDDTFEAGVLVSNRTGGPGELAVTAEAEGLTLQGPSTQTLALAAGETRVVRFRWAADAPGDAALTFTAQLGDERDGLVTPLPVLRPLTKQAVATFASTDDVRQEALALPPDHLPGLGRLDVQLASTALVGLDAASRYLFEYPYGCLEQRTSRVRPLMLADALLEAFDLEALGGQADAAQAEWVQMLDDFWTGDGFSLWPGGYYANPYVSAYVVLALAEAKAAGLAVPQDLIEVAADALTADARSRTDRPEYYSAAVWADTRAFMFYALARHGRIFEDEVATLAGAAVNNPGVSVEQLSHLLRTITLTNRPALNRLQAPLMERLQAMVRVEGTTAYLAAPTARDYWWIFSSTARTTAYGLTALIEAAPTEDTQQLAQRMIRYLMRNQQGGHWASTQENAAIIDAFRAYYEAFEQATPDFAAEVRLAGQTLVSQSFQGRSTAAVGKETPLASLPATGTADVEIHKTGTGTLYYALLLETYTSTPLPAHDQGLRVERRIQRLDDRGLPLGSPLLAGTEPLTLDAGALVRITLRLTSPTDRNYVVVDDALPAGLEPLNTAFLTTNDNLTEDTGTSRWWGSFNHSEMKDDRVLLFADYLTRGEHTYTYVARATTPGTFVHPAVQAELMYQPETNGRSAPGKLTVNAPILGMASR